MEGEREGERERGREREGEREEEGGIVIGIGRGSWMKRESGASN